MRVRHVAPWRDSVASRGNSWYKIPKSGEFLECQGSRKQICDWRGIRERVEEVEIRKVLGVRSWKAL